MRAQHAAKQVVRGAHVGHPVAHGLVDRIFQGAGAGIHAANLRAQQSHAKDVQLLAPHVFRSHIDDTLKAQQRAYRRRGHAVLARASLSDHAMLAHALDQQRLSQAVVNFVRACVQQVFALEINLGAAELFRQPPRKEQGRGTPGVRAQQFIQTALETAVALGLLVVRAPVLPARPSGFQGHSVRRRRQSGRGRLLLRSLGPFRYRRGRHFLFALRSFPYCPDKSADLLRILFPRTGFYPGSNIHPPWLHDANRIRNIRGVEATSDDHINASTHLFKPRCSLFPIKCLAGAARLLRRA